MPINHSILCHLKSIAIPVAALFVAVVLTIAWPRLGFDILERASSLIILIYLFLALFAFPLRYSIVSIILVIFFILFLGKINEIKIALTQLPLTFMDLSITLHDPEGFFNAIGLSPSFIYIIYGVSSLILIIILGIAGREILKTNLRNVNIINACIRIMAFLVPLILLWNFTNHFVDQERTSVLTEDAVWQPKGVTALSRKIGLISFLVFSYDIGHDDTGDYFDITKGEKLPDNKEIINSLNLFVTPRYTPYEDLPNIILMQAESTFDINRTFELTTPVRNQILKKNGYTQALGPLHVNTIGGGSWVTEFETITGIDSRLFGYSGYYTHSSLSPFISSTFVTYLNNYGYKTYSFYSAPGKFYNARNAYKSYGIGEFYDNIDLGRPRRWSHSDLEIVGDAIRTLRQRATEPFFAFIDSNQNHAPHPCKNFGDKQQFISSLRNSDDFAINCELNEYVLRLADTSTAFEQLLRYLEEIESKTSRPFVLLLYGDHQPHTFTQEGAVAESVTPHDYRPYRLATVKETVFHLASSKPGIVHCCERDPPPATILPSMLSAYVASAPSDVYLGVNFFLYRYCGSDFLTGAHQKGLYGRGPQAGNRTPDCEDAYNKALAYYRQFGPLSQYTRTIQ